MKNIDIMKNKLDEQFGEQIKDLKTRYKITDKLIDKIITRVCYIPEQYFVRLDNTDLWCILKYAIWTYIDFRNNSELKGLFDMNMVIDEAYNRFCNDGNFKDNHNNKHR